MLELELVFAADIYGGCMHHGACCVFLDIMMYHAATLMFCVLWIVEVEHLARFWRAVSDCLGDDSERGPSRGASR